MKGEFKMSNIIDWTNFEKTYYISRWRDPAEVYNQKINEIVNRIETSKEYADLIEFLNQGINSNSVVKQTIYFFPITLEMCVRYRLAILDSDSDYFSPLAVAKYVLEDLMKNNIPFLLIQQCDVAILDDYINKITTEIIQQETFLPLTDQQAQIIRTINMRPEYVDQFIKKVHKVLTPEERQRGIKEYAMWQAYEAYKENNANVDIYFKDEVSRYTFGLVEMVDDSVSFKIIGIDPASTFDQNQINRIETILNTNLDKDNPYLSTSVARLQDLSDKWLSNNQTIQNDTIAYSSIIVVNSQNIALNKTIVDSNATEFKQYEQQITDGDETTCWRTDEMIGSSPVVPQYFVIDLIRSASIDTIKIIHDMSRAWPTKLKIQTSKSLDDNWIDLFVIDRESTDEEKPNEVFLMSESLVDTNIIYRYLRFYFEGVNSYASILKRVSIAEVKVNGYYITDMPTFLDFQNTSYWFNITPPNVIMFTGTELTLKSTGAPTDNSYITWESTNSDIITVDTDGKVSAIAEGRTLVKATFHYGTVDE